MDAQECHESHQKHEKEGQKTFVFFSGFGGKKS